MSRRDQLYFLCKEAENFCRDLFSFNKSTLKMRYRNIEDAILDKTTNLVQRAQAFLDKSELTDFHNRLDRFFNTRKPKTGDVFVFYGHGDLTSSVDYILKKEIKF